MVIIGSFLTGIIGITIRDDFLIFNRIMGLLNLSIRIDPAKKLFTDYDQDYF